MTEKQRLQAEAAYENAHLVAQDLVGRIRELLEDLPAPSDERPDPLDAGGRAGLRQRTAGGGSEVLGTGLEAETPDGRRGGWFPPPDDGSHSIDYEETNDAR